MKPLPFSFDPYGADTGRWGASLANNAELLVGALDAAQPDSVGEVGAYAGDLTGLLLEWAATAGAGVVAVDPSPQPELVELAEREPNLTLDRRTSIDALADMELPAAMVLDGDHNYWTVSEELRLIGERSQGGPLPLLLFHDVSWPHARRDDYFDPEAIPADYRQPTHEGGGLFPGEEHVRPGGLPYKWPAAHEGGERNGVLTAIEDFVAADDALRLVVVPAFFGFGAVWHADAPYAAALAEFLEPWDQNPLLERLEANRVFHLASMHMQMIEAAKAHQRLHRQQAVLQRLLDSSAFAVAERLSHLRRRLGIGAHAAELSKDDVRSAMGR